MGPLCSVQGLQHTRSVTGSPGGGEGWGWGGGVGMLKATTAGLAAKPTYHRPVQSRVESRHSLCREGSTSQRLKRSYCLVSVETEKHWHTDSVQAVCPRDLPPTRLLVAACAAQKQPQATPLPPAPCSQALRKTCSPVQPMGTCPSALETAILGLCP